MVVDGVEVIAFKQEKDWDGSKVGCMWIADWTFSDAQFVKIPACYTTISMGWDPVPWTACTDYSHSIRHRLHWQLCKFVACMQFCWTFPIAACPVNLWGEFNWSMWTSWKIAPRKIPTEWGKKTCISSLRPYSVNQAVIAQVILSLKTKLLLQQSLSDICSVLNSGTATLF